MGTEIPGGGRKHRLYLTLHCHRQNDIKMAIDKSHFNASLIVRGKVTKTVPINHNLLKRERRAEAEPNRGPSVYQPNAFSRGETGSRCHYHN